MDASIYDRRFYDWVNLTSLKSAEIVIPLVNTQVAPSSVLDVGCGQGAWLSIWAKTGVHDVFGIDGTHVDLDDLLIPRDQFQSVDLRHPWGVNRRFDLVQCLEVAEHIPKSDAKALIERLCEAGDIIFFSAAQPGQGGAGHVNEQAPSYWAELFAMRGYIPFDSLRPLLSAKREVAPWYRFNAMLFANERGSAGFSASALNCAVSRFDDLDSAGDWGWALRRALLRRLPVGAVTLLSALRYRIVLLLRSITQS
jgi:SAM-dependent methyltransferase